jgi:hypothetical protein
MAHAPLAWATEHARIKKNQIPFSVQRAGSIAQSRRNHPVSLAALAHLESSRKE